MEKSSPTSAKAAPFASASKLQVLDQAPRLEGVVARGLPFGQFQFVDVTFPGAGYQDLLIRHALKTADPETIRAIPVQWSFRSYPADPPYVYKDVSASRRAWTDEYIVLRCNLANAQVRLLLFVEASE